MVGGEERHVRNLAVALAGRGHEVHVATLDVGGAAPTSDVGVQIHLLDNLGQRVPALYPTADRPLALPIPDPLTARALSRLLEQLDPDVVHVHNWIVNSLVALPRARRVPVVHSLHDYGHVCATKRLVRDGAPCPGPTPRACIPCAGQHYGTGRGQVIWGAVRAGLPLRRAVVDVFTPVSSYVADANRLAEDGSTFEVVPNFVPDDLLDRRDVARDPALPAGDYVFFAGDLSEEKGVGTLVRAHARLAHPRPALVLVGRPVLDLDAAVGGDGVGGGLADDVHVHHYWDHDRVVSGFAHALAAALPSQWPDPCPTTVLEAMALGAPLVTTHQGGIADMVTPEVSALVVPSGDVEALAAALRRLGDDADLRARLRAGADAGVTGFLQSTVAARLEAIYTSAVARLSTDG